MAAFTLCCVFVFYKLGSSVAWAQAQDCPGAQQVLRETGGGSGDGNQGHGPFSVDSNAFLVRFDTQPTDNTPGAGVSVGVNSENLPGVVVPVRNDNFDAEEGGSLLIQDDPGDYSISVGFVDTTYTVTVEECTGTGGGDDTTTPSPSPQPPS